MYMELPDSEGALTGDLSAAWSQVATAVAAVDTALGKWLMDDYGVGLTEYRAILHLSRAADNELRINDLALKVGLNQSSVTRLVGRLEGKELAFRDTCPDDGRGVYAVVTERGVKTVREIRAPYEARIRELLQNVVEQHPQLDLVDLDRAFASVGKLIT